MLSWCRQSRDCLQALQKLQEKLTQLESGSSEALRAVQAESAKGTQAEAVRHAQTNAVADSLLAFKQSQAAELAKRDDAIAALHTTIAQLQKEQLPESLATAPPGKQIEGSAERQVLTSKGQLPTAERPQSVSSRDASVSVVPDAGQAGPELMQVPVPAVQQSRAQPKGRASLSADRNKGRQQRAMGRPAVRLDGQKPAAVRRSTTAADTGTPKQQVRPLSEVPLDEVSGHAGAVAESDDAVGPAQVSTPL